MPWMFFKWARFEQGTGETWVASLAEARLIACIHPGSWDTGMTCIDLSKKTKNQKNPKETCHVGSHIRPPRWIVEKAQSIAP